MQVFKVSKEDAEVVKKFWEMNTQLEEGKAEASSGDKKTKATKAFLIEWMLRERKFLLEGQPKGTVIIIQVEGKDGFQDCFKIERKNSGDKLDVKALQNAKPAIATEFTKPSIASYFDPIPPKPAG